MSWNKTKQTIDAPKNCEALSKSQKKWDNTTTIKKKGVGGEGHEKN